MRRSVSRAVRYAWVCFSLMEGNPLRRPIALRVRRAVSEREVEDRECMIDSFLQD